jgi:hypothetical protein
LAAENFGVGLELSGKVFSLERKAFNRKERKDVAKNAKENLEGVRFLFTTPSERPCLS